MARRAKSEDKPTEATALKVPRSDAERRLDQQIERGRALLDRAPGIASRDEYAEWRDEIIRWDKFTTEVLKAIYTTDEPATEFNRSGATFMALGPTSLAEDLEDDVKDLRRDVNRLVSLRERLELIPALAEEQSGLGARRDPEPGDPRVFIAHGRDGETKEKVVRQLEKAGPHEVIVLHEQPNEGRTLIEKFEEHAKRSDYAVVLLTADDVGALADEADKLMPRARQNVVFELGFFVGAIGRARVAVIYEDGVELPSDFRGIVYIGAGDETWRFKLLQELKAAGLDYDLNEIVA
jgi:predicted nucleotide-binding protein